MRYRSSAAQVREPVGFPASLSAGLMVSALFVSLALPSRSAFASPPAEGGPTGSPAQPVAALTPAAPTTAPAPAPSCSIRVCIMMIVRKNFGFFAHLVGKEDATIVDGPYDPKKAWWDNPMVVFKDDAYVDAARVARGTPA